MRVEWSIIKVDNISLNIFCGLASLIWPPLISAVESST
jgi:hypothetical protein